ncbi:tape measure protein [Pseudovibrio sp. Tun.PSC04-5.I4]|uniref:tape measure protein n=1 Tax=Pseudovibrio sp. Tun.PSC04-5.I4 TaxID=1798213 RepID=UPI000882B50E|nr:tape measure protein [Pseudovibrio sp. Tun.PSC04-5.I4]SDQ70361.1 tape measure domain-containing protein [Pseudovibrio sp. Tun.PSC04-5.I4]
MRLGITAEFKDRASKGLKKLLKFNERMEKQLKTQEKLSKGQSKATLKQVKATEKTAKATGKVAKAAESVAKANKNAASGAASLAGHTGEVASQIDRASGSMGRLVGKTDAAVRKAGLLKRAFNKVKGATKSLQKGGALIKSGGGKIARGAAVGAGLIAGASVVAGVAANTVIGPAAQMENYKVQLAGLEGSEEKAEQAMSWIRGFADKTPLLLNEVVESYKLLKSMGIDPTNGSLQALTDTMSLNGGKADYLHGIILAVGQAWNKGKLQAEEAMQLQERGIPVWDMLSKATGKTSAALMEMASKGELGREVISKLVELMGNRAAGSSEELSKTWDGMVSNIMGRWLDFQLMIADAGVFDWAKEKLQGFLDKLNTMKADGSLQQWAEDISKNIITGLEDFWVFAKEVIVALRATGGALSEIADMMGGWTNLVRLMIKLPFIAALISIVTGLVQIGVGLAALGPVLASLGAGLAALTAPFLIAIAIVAALAVAAWLIYDNWDVVSVWLAAAWAWIADMAVVAWDILKALFGWTPLGMIVNNWGEITTWLATFWEDIKTTASTAWTGLKTLFGWTPLGMIVNNWGEITTWLDTFWTNLKSKVSVKWADLQAVFTDWNWPGLPEFKLPSFTAVKQAFTNFFSGSWLPKVDTFSTFWEGLTSMADGVWQKLSGIFEAIGTAGKTLTTTIGETLFGWTPLDKITANWGEITTWLDTFWTDLKSKALVKWADLQAVFTDWNWPGLPEFKLPSFTAVKQAFTDFFSGSWLPKVDTFSTFWERLTSLADGAWQKLSGIFEAIGTAGKTLATTVGETLKSLADMAGKVWSSVTGPEGADRFIDQLTEVAENGWSSDFMEGLALTEALQAGQVNLDTYQQKLAAIALGGGEFASHAQKMMDLSRQLEGHSGFSQQEQAPTSLAEVEKASAALEALQVTSRAAIAEVDNLLGGVDFAYHGQRMMETIAVGMRTRAHLLVEEMRQVTKVLRDHLPSSPAKLGPLSDIHRLKFSETIAQSIKPAPMVRAMRKAAAATMAAATLSTATVSPSLAASAPQAITPPAHAIQAAGGSGGTGQGGTISVTFSPKITVGSGASITKDELAELLEDQAEDLVALLLRKIDEKKRLEF